MIIASDFDGTIYKGGRISASDRAAIAGWQEMGHRFGIVTGRGREILDTAKEKGVVCDYSIVFNGACVTDGVGNVLYEAFVPLAVEADYFAFVDQFAQDEPGTVQYALYDAKRGDTPENRRGICQFSLVFATDAEANAVTAQLNAHFGETLVSYANGRCVNTVKKGISKATGIAVYAELTGVRADEIYVVGDNYNDLPMLLAYDGYVVNSACDDMKARVKHHCEDMKELAEIAYRRHKDGKEDGN